MATRETAPSTPNSSRDLGHTTRTDRLERPKQAQGANSMSRNVNETNRTSPHRTHAPGNTLEATLMRKEQLGPHTALLSSGALTRAIAFGNSRFVFAGTCTCKAFVKK